MRSNVFKSDKCDEKLSKVISYDDAIELLRRDFPSKHDMFVREKMKKQRESMVMNVSAEEMPAQLRKAAKSVSVTFLSELCSIVYASRNAFRKNHSRYLNSLRN